MSDKNEIPWARPYFGAEEMEYVQQTLDSKWLSQGQRVIDLENRLIELTGSPYAVAVNSGTAALDIALKLFSVNPEDEILVPAFAYIASVNCVLYQGATPVFVDVDPRTYNISPEEIKQKITSCTKGIVAIDYAGHAAAWNELRQIAEQHNLFLVEDAAPALGGSYHGKILGTLGDIGITSFHAAKTFTTVEGGMLFMRDAELAERARMIRSHGESFKEKYRHVELGHNYRMTDLHAAIGLGQFSRYDKIVESRRTAADYYSKQLADVPGLVLPHIRPDNQHAWFLYPLLVEKRDKVRAFLAENGIGTNVSWPYPAYRQPYLERYFQETCPVTERLCNTVLCLPLYYEITQVEQDIVIQSLKEAVAQS